MVCTTEQADDQNCGSCGNICPTDLTTCSSGKCRCDQGTDTYRASDAGMICTNASIDDFNCGDCGNICTPGVLTCITGNCECPGSSETLCTTDAGVESCADTSGDPMNCGQCNLPCLPTFSCNQGACICPRPKMVCGPDGGADSTDGGDSICTNTSFDPRNCGFCGFDCTVEFGAKATCEFGNCE